MDHQYGPAAVWYPAIPSGTIAGDMTSRNSVFPFLSLVLGLAFAVPTYAQSQPGAHPIVLHAARLLDIKNGRMLKPGEVLVQGERIVEAGPR